MNLQYQCTDSEPEAPADDSFIFDCFDHDLGQRSLCCCSQLDEIFCFISNSNNFVVSGGVREIVLQTGCHLFCGLVTQV